MYGYTGRSLRVDLSAGLASVFETPERLCRDFIGGRGLGVALVADKISLPWDDPAMPMVFATGPLVGTKAPTSGRMAIVSRSPLTGTVFDCSVGGRLGTNFKRAGFDAVILTGKADRWSVLTIDSDHIDLSDAGELAGANTSALEDAFGRRWSYAGIGRSGEKGVRFASIIVDGHFAAGRGGLGALMGAKMLKAIRVKGERSVRVADPEGLDRARADIMRQLRASPAVFGEFGLSRFGTAALVDLIHARRMEPTENFRKTFHPTSGQYSGYVMRNVYQTRRDGCAGCPILCKKRGSSGESMPEFETVSHFGALNACDDLAAIVAANRLCNDYGLDTISAASTLACHGEIIGRCLNTAEIQQLLLTIAERKDAVGNALGEGSFCYARSVGRPELSMSVKGLELPAYDPRGAYGMALSYATSNRGGCHLRAYPVSHEILRKPVATNRFTFEGKARIVKIAEDMNAVVDSLTACKFAFFGAGLEEYARAFTAVTGVSCEVQSLLRIGERIWNLERQCNSINGFDESHDDLPARFFSEEGSSSGAVRIDPIDRQAFLQARENYYRVRGYRQ